jgi:GntR family transcriptional regulator
MTRFVPRYYEIEQALRARISALDAHQPLPSDAMLCEEFGVSRMTARNAVLRLVQDGLVYRVPGRGTFVAPEPGAGRTASHVLSFTDEMRRRGREPRSRLVARTRRPATEEERQALGVDDVAVVRRVRLADDEPVALETAVFPAERALPLLAGDLERSSLHATLVAEGIVPTAGRASLGSEAATAEDARLLGIKKGAPLLVERRLIRDQAGEPIELTESRYVGGRYELKVDFDVEVAGER